MGPRKEWRRCWKLIRILQKRAEMRTWARKSCGFPGLWAVNYLCSTKESKTGDVSGARNSRCSREQCLLSEVRRTKSLERCLLLLPFVPVRSSTVFSPSSLCFLTCRRKFFHLQKGLNQTVHWKALAHNKASTIASYDYDCFVIFWEGNRIKDAITGVSRNLWIMAASFFFLSSRVFFRWGFTWDLNI